jgi:L-threonylcarbamoyladenylate synthase
MQTKLLQEGQIDEAISLLKAGEIVALPTETVYGLAADAKNESAIKKIFIAKNRPTNHPLILHIDSFYRIKEWTDHIPDYAYKLSENFWPGPLTILLNKKHNVSNVITGGSTKIALRIPNNHLMQEIIKSVGALVAPSANTYKKLSPTRAEHVMKDLSGKISAVLDGGSCSIGIESTIIDLTDKTPKILRPGAITKDMIENSLQIKIPEYKNHTEQVPGNMLAHYQPNTPCYLMTLSDIEDYIRVKEDSNIAVMHFSLFKSDKVKLYPIASDRSGFTKSMYDILHHIDKSRFRKILIELPPKSWSDINDRLYKAQYNKEHSHFS